MENVVRVDCLYRVSTIGQVEKNDIPMQREFCRAFIAEHPNWKLEKEVYEKGVSGFKKSAKERDAIQELQRDAVEGKFDILLVYMFDRLGRKDDETPFIVEWFVRNGVEVWSATEGQQRFDNHVDKLLNYIRYPGYFLFLWYVVLLRRDDHDNQPNPSPAVPILRER